MTYKTGDWVQVKSEAPVGKRYKVKKHWAYERSRKKVVAYTLEGNDFLQEEEELEPAEIRVGDTVRVRSLGEILDWAEEKGCEIRVSYPTGVFCGGFYLVDDFFSAKSLKKWYVTVEIKGRKNYVKTII